jgi:NADP-dependent 3-hydroxy acid dehydrogenase YdfG
MSHSADLTNHTAVITGSSSGIGRAIAERLGAAGAHVVLSGRTEDAMRASADRIEASGGHATVVVSDVRDEAAMRALVDTAVTETGRLDVFVNNAGVASFAPILDADPDIWRAMLDTNIFSLLVGCQAAVRAMRALGNPGRIINVSSVAAHGNESGVYGATKHAVNVISNTLRQELMDDPIQVTTIMPGLVATNIGRNVDPEVIAGLVAASGIDATFTPGERLPDDVLEAAQTILGQIMLKPEDVADAVLYAVSLPSSVHLAEIVIRPNQDFDL